MEQHSIRTFSRLRAASPSLFVLGVAPTPEQPQVQLAEPQHWFLLQQIDRPTKHEVNVPVNTLVVLLHTTRYHRRTWFEGALFQQVCFTLTAGSGPLLFKLLVTEEDATDIHQHENIRTGEKQNISSHNLRHTNTHTRARSTYVLVLSNSMRDALGVFAQVQVKSMGATTLLLSVAPH